MTAFANMADHCFGALAMSSDEYNGIETSAERTTTAGPFPVRRKPELIDH